MLLRFEKVKNIRAAIIDSILEHCMEGITFLKRYGCSWLSLKPVEISLNSSCCFSIGLVMGFQSQKPHQESQCLLNEFLRHLFQTSNLPMNTSNDFEQIPMRCSLSIHEQMPYLLCKFSTFHAIAKYAYLPFFGKNKSREKEGGPRMLCLPCHPSLLDVLMSSQVGV